MGEDILKIHAPSRSYDVLLSQEGLKGLGGAISQRTGAGRAILVSNPVVGELYAEQALASLRDAAIAGRLILVPDGESSKNLRTWAELLADLLDAGVDRRTPIVVLGGGVTGDLAGFAASSVLRGAPLVQVPTTLLAMVDSSVGGKTGFNMPQGKNLVGSFYQPSLVYVATEVLGTLPEPEWRCGLGEVIKYGMIRDLELLEELERNASAILDREAVAVLSIVRKCIGIKAEVVAADEQEQGLRAILNFGHTVGHAVEVALGFGVLRHGEAVGLGMVAETRFALAEGVCLEPALPDRLHSLLSRLGLPVVAPFESHGGTLRQRLVAAASLDKKAACGTIMLPLSVRAGEVCLKERSLARLPDLFSYLP